MTPAQHDDHINFDGTYSFDLETKRPSTAFTSCLTDDVNTKRPEPLRYYGNPNSWCAAG